ncbi:MAG: cytochrome-c peroxidase [Acidobacteria bacterium]|nr:MAG: cytochrome-c peroxidase [Acidobacteriota bacterium]
MRLRQMFLLGIVLVVVGACSPATKEEAVVATADTTADQELWKWATVRFEPLPGEALNPDNPLTPAKIELGKALYYDTRLSKDGNISCDSCHDLALFGVDNLPTSPGDTGQLGGRNSPTVLNAALHGSQFWDGRAKDVEEQAGMPILNPVEMAIPSEEFLVERLAADAEYQRLFAEAFPGEDPALTYQNIAKALAAFERTLLTPTRFDSYLEGDREALTVEEKAGLRFFIENGCSTCHNGVNVGAYSFQKFGLQGDYWEHTLSETIDEGRYTLTNDEADKFVFRVASLRNIEKTAPYFHDGSIDTLDEAVRVMFKVQLGRELTDEEAASLVAFLESMTGEVPEEALEEGHEAAG